MEDLVNDGKGLDLIPVKWDDCRVFNREVTGSDF